jgi:hypothetical protein
MHLLDDALYVGNDAHIKREAAHRLVTGLATLPFLNTQSLSKRDVSTQDDDHEDHSTSLSETPSTTTSVITSSVSLPTSIDEDAKTSHITTGLVCSLYEVEDHFCHQFRHIASHVTRGDLGLPIRVPTIVQQWCNGMVSMLSLTIRYQRYADNADYYRYYPPITPIYHWRLPSLLSYNEPEAPLNKDLTNVIIDAPLLRHWYAPVYNMLISQLKLLMKSHDMISIDTYDFNDERIYHVQPGQRFSQLDGYHIRQYDTTCTDTQENHDWWDKEGLSSLANVALTNGISIWPKLERFVGCINNGQSIPYPLLQSSLLLSIQRLRIIRFNCIDITINDIWTIMTNNNMTLECLHINTPLYRLDSDRLVSKRVKQLHRRLRRSISSDSAITSNNSNSNSIADLDGKGMIPMELTTKNGIYLVKKQHSVPYTRARFIPVKPNSKRGPSTSTTPLNRHHDAGCDTTTFQEMLGHQVIVMSSLVVTYFCISCFDLLTISHFLQFDQ